MEVPVSKLVPDSNHVCVGSNFMSLLPEPGAEVENVSRLKSDLLGLLQLTTNLNFLLETL